MLSMVGDSGSPCVTPLKPCKSGPYYTPLLLQPYIAALSKFKGYGKLKASRRILLGFKGICTCPRRQVMMSGKEQWKYQECVFWADTGLVVQGRIRKWRCGEMYAVSWSGEGMMEAVEDQGWWWN